MSNATQAINKLDATINSFKTKIDVKVNEVSRSSDEVQVTTDQIYQNISKFREQMYLSEEKQIAHENILRIDQMIKEQFSNHETIRRTIMGIVRDFDINLVRNSTIQELSEELWITSSRYWLSYALIAVTAWVNNYPEVAKNALAESGRRDAVKTTLFFCLMNLRFGRTETAKRWFYEYFKTLDPTMLQQETAIVLQAFLNGIFGRDQEMEHEVVTLIDKWISIIKDSEEISNALLSAYENYINNLRPTQEFSYSHIMQFCTNTSEAQGTFLAASKFKAMLDMVKSYETEEEQGDLSGYKERIDAVLMDLISKYDEEELTLLKQQNYFKCIIEYDGDKQAAEQKYEEMERQSSSQNFNIGRQMIMWALYDSERTNAKVRRFGFQNTRSWFKEAVERFHAKLEEQIPRDFSLSIDTWEGISTGNDRAMLTESMKTHFENHKFQNMYVNTPNIAALIVFVISIALAFLTPFSLIATAAAAGFLVFRVIKAQKDYKLRIEKALENLNRCLDEIAEYQTAMSEMCTLKNNVLSEADFV